jgi:hypothetical protein
VIEAQRRQGIQTLAHNIEAPVAIQQSLTRTPRYFGSKAEVFEFLFRTRGNGDGLVGKRW